MVVAAAADVAVLDGQLVGHGLGAIGAVRGRCAGWTAPSHRFHYRDLITGEKPREIVTIFEFDSDGERNWAVPVHSYRWGPFTDPSGIEHKIYDYPGLVVDPQKWNPNPNVLKNVRIPLRPHFGNLGLTQKEADIVNSIPPDYIGGNVDDWRFGKGALSNRMSPCP